MIPPKITYKNPIKCDLENYFRLLLKSEKNNGVYNLDAINRD